jgi:hypothetical protein
MDKYINSLDIQFGNWVSRLIGCSTFAAQTLEIFKKIYKDFCLEKEPQDPISQIIFVHSPIVSGDIVIPFLQGISEKDFSKFVQLSNLAFKEFKKTSESRNIESGSTSDSFIFSLSVDRVNSQLPTNLNKSIQLHNVVIEHEDFRHNLLSILFFLATQWHIERGGLFIHSSAIDRDGNGFLFIGESEAGKSTVARLSTEVGGVPLGDDLNFIIQNGKEYQLGSSPSPIINTLGYSQKKPICKAIFILVQDERDFLVQMTSMQMMRRIFKSIFGETPYYTRLSKPHIRSTFINMGKLCRQIPGYELHFRKSPDFWKVIDAEFGLG